MSCDAPIGIFDSGLGGLTVFREVSNRLPGENLLYLADMAHVPYGPRPAEEVRGFAHDIIGFLAARGAKVVVAACNMSSAVAVELPRAAFPVPALGMIQPAVRAAVAAHPGGPLGVLATEGTVRSQAYPRQARRLRSHLRVLTVACPEFVPLVEAGAAGSPAARQACARYMKPLLRAGARTVVLGCTHYPYLLPALREVAPQVRFIDPAAAVAAELQALLECRGLLRCGLPSQHGFLSTAEPGRLEQEGARFLGTSIHATLCRPDDLRREAGAFALPRELRTAAAAA